MTDHLHAYEELCAGAHAAAARADLDTLGHLAGRLAGLLRDRPELAAELRSLSTLCGCDAERALGVWRHLGKQLPGGAGAA